MKQNNIPEQPVSALDMERLARLAKALSHPTRMAIMYFLSHKGSCYFGDIHNELPIAKATVSQHLKELKDTGLIIGKEEIPKVCYSVNLEVWNEMRAMFADFFDLCGCHKKDCHCEHSELS